MHTLNPNPKLKQKGPTGCRGPRHKEGHQRVARLGLDFISAWSLRGSLRKLWLRVRALQMGGRLPSFCAEPWVHGLTLGGAIRGHRDAKRLRASVGHLKAQPQTLEPEGWDIADEASRNWKSYKAHYIRPSIGWKFKRCPPFAPEAATMTCRTLGSFERSHPNFLWGGCPFSLEGFGASAVRGFSAFQCHRNKYSFLTSYRLKQGCGSKLQLQSPSFKWGHGVKPFTKTSMPRAMKIPISKLQEWAVIWNRWQGKADLVTRLKPKWRPLSSLPDGITLTITTMNQKIVVGCPGPRRRCHVTASRG